MLRITIVLYLAKMSGPTHNLNIQEYSLSELLGLFELNSYDIGVEDLKRCKKKVLMLHPDKSKLESKYFLFYKKAFDVIVEFYDNQHRQNKTIQSKDLAYDPQYNNSNENTTKQVSKTIEKMSKTNFNEKFNELFENNFVHQDDNTKNDWFKEEQNQFSVPEGKVSKQRMDEAFHQIKQQSNHLIKYTGVQNLHENSATSNNYYQDEDNDNYVTSDPFGKLKFDDLRKVHRDQTVLSVSENDIHNIKTFRSVDEFNQDRSQHSYDPMEKEHADKLLQQQEEAMRNKMMQKEYKSKLEIERNSAKNQQVLSSFLLLQNKK